MKSLSGYSMFWSRLQPVTSFLIYDGLYESNASYRFLMWEACVVRMPMILALLDAGSITLTVVERTVATGHAVTHQPWKWQWRPKTGLMRWFWITAASRHMNCGPQQGLENQQLWPSSEKLATEESVQNWCWKWSPSTINRPNET
jgi:hypothetical protein